MALIPVDFSTTALLGIRPVPDAGLTENTVVSTFNAADGTSSEVPSLFGIQRWSNMKTFRVKCPAGGIGHYGIGEWQDSIIGTPTVTDETNWGWWHDDAFVVPAGYSAELSFKFDPSTGESITLGGYILDTTTGYLCVKFANYVIDNVNAKVFVDITYTRNDYPTT